MAVILAIYVMLYEQIDERVSDFEQYYCLLNMKIGVNEYEMATC